MGEGSAAADLGASKNFQREISFATAQIPHLLRVCDLTNVPAAGRPGLRPAPPPLSLSRYCVTNSLCSCCRNHVHSLLHTPTAVDSSVSGSSATHTSKSDPEHASNTRSSVAS